MLCYLIYLRLIYLYLGGNQLVCLPSELGELASLSSLTLSGNKLQTLPEELSHLANLESLRLHDNQLQALPTNLIKLTNLKELSLRNNPLVMRFIKEWPNTVPSLLELSGRSVQKNKIPYSAKVIPSVLVEYLDGARHCDNPNCNGVYFASRYESVKFVDFCGKYRVPLMQYLCSAICDSDEGGSGGGCCMAAGSVSSSEEEEQAAQDKMKRVLLG